MSKRIALVLSFCILLAASSMLLSGCWDRKEINKLGIVLMSSIDVDENGEIIGTVQVAMPQGGGAESGQGEESKKGFYTISASGKNIHEMFQHLQERSSRELFVSHRRILLIGQAMAEKGIVDVFDYYTRDPDSRLKTYVFITKEKMAGDLLNITIPSEQIPGSAVINLAKSNIATGSTLGSIVSEMATKGIVPTIDVLEAKPASMLEKEGASWTFRLAGSAVIMDYKLAGFLDVEKMRGLMWMKDMLHNGVVTAQLTEGDNDEISFNITRTSRKVHFQFEEQNIKVHVELKADGPIYENNSTIDLSDPLQIKVAEQALSRTITSRVEETIHTVQKDLKADVFGIGQHLYQSHPSKWREVEDEWQELFPEIEFSVKTEVKVRRSGGIGAPLHIKEDELHK